MMFFVYAVVGAGIVFLPLTIPVNRRERCFLKMPALYVAGSGELLGTLGVYT